MTYEYILQRLREFRENGSIEFANDSLLPIYERALKANHQEYCVIEGLGQYGVRTAICVPSLRQMYIERLDREIDDLIKLLAEKQRAMKKNLERE